MSQKGALRRPAARCFRTRRDGCRGLDSVVPAGLLRRRRLAPIGAGALHAPRRQVELGGLEHLDPEGVSGKRPELRVRPAPRVPPSADRRRLAPGPVADLPPRLHVGHPVVPGVHPAAYRGRGEPRLGPRGRDLPGRSRGTPPPPCRASSRWPAARVSRASRRPSRTAPSSSASLLPLTRGPASPALRGETILQTHRYMSR